MTYGQIRYSLSKSAPGCDIELIDEWIQDRAQQILDTVPWRRLETETVIQWPASYAVGTLVAVQGSVTISGDGSATWVPGMTGLMIRIGASPEYYIFTYQSATTALIDRPYEQPTASGLSYRIDQLTVQLPPEVKIPKAIRSLHPGCGPIKLISMQELNRLFPRRNVYGTPQYAAWSWDSNSDPPCIQLEFYPIAASPDSSGVTQSYVLDYVYEGGVTDPGDTSASVLPWLRPGCLMAGVRADIALWGGKLEQAELYEAKFKDLLAQMLRVNAAQIVPEPLRLSPQYVGGKQPYYPRGPWRRGFTG